jgi:hypothetical protein
MVLGYGRPSPFLAINGPSLSHYLSIAIPSLSLSIAMVDHAVFTACIYSMMDHTIEREREILGPFIAIERERERLGLFIAIERERERIGPFIAIERERESLGPFKAKYGLSRPCCIYHAVNGRPCCKFTGWLTNIYRFVSIYK